MNDRTYRIEGAALGCDAGFKGDEVFVHFFGKPKTCRISQISEVVVKNAAMTGGEEITIRITYTEGGKEKKFQAIQGKLASPATFDFMEDLQSRIESHTKWTDQRKKGVKVDEEGNKSYDIQVLMPFSYAGAGLSRTLQIWIYLICLGVLVFPLIYFIIVLVRGGYRIYTNDEGLTVRKLRDTFYPWQEINEVEITRVNVINRENYSKTDVLKLRFIGKNGKKKKVVMRYNQALPLIKELGERNVISMDLVNQFT